MPAHFEPGICQSAPRTPTQSRCVSSRSSWSHKECQPRLTALLESTSNLSLRNCWENGNLRPQIIEHHAAHELCHCIAGCCGLSLKIQAQEERLNKCESLTGTDEELAVCSLLDSLGSFLTHIAVHKLLHSSGYADQDWDSYLVEEARNKTALVIVQGYITYQSGSI